MLEGMLKRIALHCLVCTSLGGVGALIMIALPTSAILIVKAILGGLCIFALSFWLGESTKGKILFFVVGCIITIMIYFVTIITLFVIEWSYW